MTRARIICHVVLSTYRRQPMITHELESIVHKSLARGFREAGALASYINGVSDHVHAILWLDDSVCIAELIEFAKTHAQQTAKRHDPGFLWQSGWSVDSVNPHDYKRLVIYVRDQKARHARATTLPEHEYHPGDH